MTHLAETLTLRERRILVVVVCAATGLAAVSNIALAAAFGWRAMVAGLLCVLGGFVWALALTYASIKERQS